MELRKFVDSTKRLFQVTTKPSRDEFWLLTKVSLIGVVAVGAIGFMIRILFFFIGLMP